MKVVIIGPTWPYRGGITHYNNWLCNFIKKGGIEVISISFKKLYPTLLYPGKKQLDKEQKNLCDFPINNELNSLNPINWIKVARKINKLNPNFVIIYWWTPFFSIMNRILTSLIKPKIILLCHNVLPHEESYIDKLLTKFAIKKIDHFIVHGEEEKQKLKNINKNILDNNITVIVHPTYNHQFKKNKITKTIAKTKLKLDGKVLLFFGFIRPYKGLEYLIKAMPEINTILNDIKLLIVGEFWEDKSKYLNIIHNQLNLENVIIKDSYIPDEEVAYYFNASDIIILPYVSASSSGIVQIAYSFNKPVIVTNVGVLHEIVTNNETGFIIPSQDSSAIARTVIDFYKKANIKKMEEKIEQKKVDYSWEKLVEKIINIYRTRFSIEE